MADILIRGVAVPDRCDYRCPFYVSKGFQVCGLTGKSYNWGLDRRPSDCPIIELPEHGDLISREEALSMPFANGKYDHENADEHFIYGCETYKEWLEQLPVVILSNKEDDE